MQHDLYRTTPRMRAALSLCVFCGLLAMAPMAAAAQACAALTVDNAWVRIVPGAPVAAGYFDLTNRGDTPIVVDAVSSPQFGRVRMHESSVDADGMATMQPVDALQIAPGQTVSFAPGGYHLMMFKPVAQLQPGDSVTLQVACAGTDTTRQVAASVRSMMPSAMQHEKMNHAESMQ